MTTKCWLIIIFATLIGSFVGFAVGVDPANPAQNNGWLALAGAVVGGGLAAGGWLGRDMDGFRLCRLLRERDVHSAILMLTARDAVPDRVSGLEAGAGDYLVKPFAQQKSAVIVPRLSSGYRHPGFQPIPAS